MLRIINGRHYNTDTATKIGEAKAGDYVDENAYWEQWLYRKQCGDYFMHSKIRGISTFQPMSEAFVFDWAKKYNKTDIIKEHFSHLIEDS